MISIENYKSAYNYGVKDVESGNLTGWYTPALNAAYELGRMGKEIDFNNIVVAERYGNVPESGVSINYREQISELGVSASNLLGEEEIGSSVWFCERKKITFRGILSPVKGSDGEHLVLPLDIEQYDF